MMGMSLPASRDAALNILLLGAHSDDIEIGCGGTILKLVEAYPNACVHWLVFGASPNRRQEALKSAGLFLGTLEKRTVKVLGYRDGFFPYNGAEIKEHFEQLKREINPDLVFTHYRHDLHQDHRLINELTWNTFRSHLILEYEIPKYDGDLGSPNLFMPLDKTVCQKKIDYLFEVFASQQDKQWFTEDTFWALMRLRGIESNPAERFAEAFYIRKISWSLTDLL